LSDDRDFPDDATTRLAQPKLRAESVVLVVVDGAARGKRVEIKKGTAKVGSSPACDLVLDDRAVSRLHFEVAISPRGLRLRDLGSTNGTHVGGLNIVEAEIPAGTTVLAGSSAVRVDRVGDSLPLPPASTQDSFGALFGKSLAMRQVYAILERVAPSDTTVLLRGETGTGKEVAARSIHASSPRARGPFVAVDCGAIPESLFESELFGHAKGSFTGATGDRPGVFEEAHGGTLFLDEIGELPPALQPKLLRALETRSVRRVGTNVERPVDVRVVAATNRPLERAVNEGGFREDLYYRWAVVEVVLPPLRERPGDIAELAELFHRQRGGTAPLPRSFLESLLKRPFPGNVRELRHAVERAVLFGALDDPGAHAEAARAAASIPQSLEDMAALHLPLKEARDAWTEQFELVYVKSVLDRAGGNVTRAAELAGVNRRFMQRLMARLGIRGGEDR
jgi:transcriptional regulator with GAF, ATPase, and Fis domain